MLDESQDVSQSDYQGNQVEPNHVAFTNKMSNSYASNNIRAFGH